MSFSALVASESGGLQTVETGGNGVVTSTSSICLRHSIESWDMERQLETLRDEVRQSLDESRRSKLFCQQVRKELHDLVKSEFGVAEEDQAMLGDVASLLSNTTTLVQKFAVFETYLREKLDVERRSQHKSIIAECRSIATEFVNALREDVRGTLISFKSEVVSIRDQVDDIKDTCRREHVEVKSSVEAMISSLQASLRSEISSAILSLREQVTESSAALSEDITKAEKSRLVIASSVEALQQRAEDSLHSLRAGYHEQTKRTAELESSLLAQIRDIQRTLESDIAKVGDAAAHHVKAFKDESSSTATLWQKRVESSLADLSQQLDAVRSEHRASLQRSEVASQQAVATHSDQVKRELADQLTSLQSTMDRAVGDVSKHVSATIDHVHHLQSALLSAFGAEGDHSISSSVSLTTPAVAHDGSVAGNYHHVHVDTLSQPRLPSSSTMPEGSESLDDGTHATSHSPRSSHSLLGHVHHAAVHPRDSVLKSTLKTHVGALERAIRKQRGEMDELRDSLDQLRGESVSRQALMQSSLSVEIASVKKECIEKLASLHSDSSRTCAAIEARLAAQAAQLDNAIEVVKKDTQAQVGLIEKNVQTHIAAIESKSAERAALLTSHTEKIRTEALDSLALATKNSESNISAQLQALMEQFQSQLKISTTHAVRESESLMRQEVQRETAGIKQSAQKLQLIAQQHANAALRGLSCLLHGKSRTSLRTHFFHKWLKWLSHHRQVKRLKALQRSRTNADILIRSVVPQCHGALRYRYWRAWKRFIVARRAKHRLTHLSASLHRSALRRVQVFFFEKWRRWSRRRGLRNLAVSRQGTTRNALRLKFFIRWESLARKRLRKRLQARTASLLALVLGFITPSIGAAPFPALDVLSGVSRISAVTRPSMMHTTRGGEAVDSWLLSPKRGARSSSVIIEPSGSFSSSSYAAGRMSHADPHPYHHGRTAHHYRNDGHAPLLHSVRDSAMLRCVFLKWMASGVARIRQRQSIATVVTRESLEELRMELSQTKADIATNRSDARSVHSLVHRMFFSVSAATDRLLRDDPADALVSILTQLLEGHRSGATLGDLYGVFTMWVKSSDSQLRGIRAELHTVQTWMSAVDEELRRVQKFVRPPFK